MNLLIVEDSRSDLALIRHSIETSGMDWSIDSVADGEAALKFLLQSDEYAEAPTPSLVILDLGLPQIGGIEVLRYIRSSSKLADMPVVVLTGSQRQEDIVDTYNLRANCYLRKSESLKGMVAQLREISTYWFDQGMPLPQRRRLS